MQQELLLFCRCEKGKAALLRQRSVSSLMVQLGDLTKAAEELGLMCLLLSIAEPATSGAETSFGACGKVPNGKAMENKRQSPKLRENEIIPRGASSHYGNSGDHRR